MKYFAYGSNMNETHTSRRCLDSVMLGVGILNGWEFFVNSRGVASIVMDDNSKVYGVLYEISEKDLKQLDLYEGYPRIYSRIEEKIVYKDNETTAWVYADNNYLNEGEPRIGYLEDILDSAEYFKFPEQYIKHLKKYGTTKN